MPALANLTNEECALLVEFLDAQQKEARAHSADPQSPTADHGEQHRQELLKRLLWDARMGSATPDDEELRELAATPDVATTQVVQAGSGCCPG